MYYETESLVTCTPMKINLFFEDKGIQGTIIAQTLSYYSATGGQGAVFAPITIDQDHKQAKLGHFLKTTTVPWPLKNLQHSPQNKSVFALHVRLNACLED